ncbi:Putative Holin-X, holin superfamily III [Arthrobacter alpinus]|uniref:Putative Holin-X, holin superfamily III n=1 Tax=Arthrobacter alpinus TaxID=656366 RepID=A0A1H5K4P3_9MICC|nr:Putative Holin-X, holin superfamily III [Arthrobacter alpinus]
MTAPGTDNTSWSFTIPQHGHRPCLPARCASDGNFDSTAAPRDVGLQRFWVGAVYLGWSTHTTEAVSVTDVQKDAHIAAGEHPNAQSSVLIDAVKTSLRLVPRQLNDEIALAKLEFGDKKSRVGGVAVFAAVAVVFIALLVIALVVAAIAGLGTVLPLWLSALIVSAGLLIIIGISALVAYKKFKSLLPLLPEHAWRGIRHDLGIVKEGRDFDPATLDPAPLTREEKKAAKEEAEAAKARAAAERAAKDAEGGPKATTEELIKRTTARREHLLSLREDLVSEADVKKQATYFIDTAKTRAKESVNQAASGAVGQALDTVKERWKPLAVLAVSATACVLLLRKLVKK